MSPTTRTLRVVRIERTPPVPNAFVGSRRDESGGNIEQGLLPPADCVVRGPRFLTLPSLPPARLLPCGGSAAAAAAAQLTSPEPTGSR